MSIAEGPVSIVTASADGKVCREAVSRAAEYGVNPVVALEVAIQVNVTEGTEVRLIIRAEVVTDSAKLVLELYKVFYVHCPNSVLVSHLLDTVIGVELD